MKINEVGVVGCGFMGSGIVQLCAQNGCSVTVVDISDEALDRGLASIDNHLSRGVERGRISPGEKAAITARIKYSTIMNDLARCRIVIEAATEKLGLKKKIFRRLDKICTSDVVLATSTSTISVMDLAMVTNRPEKVIGIHFLSPVPPSRLVEIVRPATTSDETLEIAREFCKSLGKDIIVAKDTNLFVFNYLYLALTRAALELLEKGIAAAEDIDKAMTLGLGHPIGPIALADFNGIDTIYLVFKAAYDRTKDPQYRSPKALRQLYKEGRLGRKTGKGFYEYG